MSDNMKILVIDDEPVVCGSCERFLQEEGFVVKTAVEAAQGLEWLHSEVFDIVITDLKMPKVSGIDVLEHVRDNFPDVQVIMITGYSTIETAVESIKKGAFDYVPKPFTPDEILAVVKEAALKRKQTLEGIYQTDESAHATGFDNITGNSAPMLKVFESIKKVAGTDTTVLITGESGVGKELIARAIYNLSLRKDKQFIPVDCSTLSRSLLESELFGHKKGSFTGADADKRGLFEIADCGTLFLDEISNIPMDVQNKLLRVLEASEYRPVGAEEVEKVDIRLIAATNRDLQLMIEKNKFREDLYYRLNVFSIEVPPLRKRRDDIPLLAYHFLKSINRSLDKRIKGFSTEAMEILIEYDWPGNVRELKNVIERLAIMAEDDTLSSDQLPDIIERDKAGDKIKVPLTNDELKQAKSQARRKAVEDIERIFVLEALARNEWNVTRAAGETGMQRTNLQALIKKYGIKHKNLQTEMESDSEQGV